MESGQAARQPEAIPRVLGLTSNHGEFAMIRTRVKSVASSPAFPGRAIEFAIAWIRGSRPIVQGPLAQLWAGPLVFAQSSLFLCVLGIELMQLGGQQLLVGQLGLILSDQRR